MHIRAVRNYLIVFCLLSSSLFAHNASQSLTAFSEHTVEAPPTLSDSPQVSNSETTSESPDAAPPSSDPQGAGNGNVGGNGDSSVSGSGAGTGTASGTTPATTYVFPSSGKMNRYWLRNTVGPKAFIGAGFTASWNTWVTNSPDEWGRGGDGWSKRFGSSLLDNGINTSTLVLWSRAMHQDPSYYRCDCSGIWARSRHAIQMTFMARNRSGSRTFAAAKVISPFAGPMVTRNTIYPDSFGFSNAASAGAYYLLGSVGWNLVREFIWKKMLF